jgi:hypothetical protein
MTVHTGAEGDVLDVLAHETRCPACAGSGVGESITLGDPSCPVCKGSKAVVAASDHRGAVEAERAKFHEYVRQYGRLGYDGRHLDSFLRGEFDVPSRGQS